MNNAPTLIAIKSRSVVQFAELFPDVTLTTRSRYDGTWERAEANGRGEENRLVRSRPPELDRNAKPLI